MNIERVSRLVTEMKDALARTRARVVRFGLQADDQSGDSEYHWHVAVFHGVGAQEIQPFYNGIRVQIVSVVKQAITGDELVALCPICARIKRMFA